MQIHAFGTQVAALLHVAPSPQAPHDPPQPSGPHALPLQAGGQLASHWNFALQFGLSLGHAPHEPPHPSLPHILTEQSGLHAHVAAKSGQQDPTAWHDAVQ